MPLWQARQGPDKQVADFRRSSVQLCPLRVGLGMQGRGALGCELSRGPKRTDSLDAHVTIDCQYCVDCTVF